MHTLFRAFYNSKNIVIRMNVTLIIHIRNFFWKEVTFHQAFHMNNSVNFFLDRLASA